jgi:hypothetical protein
LIELLIDEFDLIVIFGILEIEILVIEKIKKIFLKMKGIIKYYLQLLIVSEKQLKLL